MDRKLALSLGIRIVMAVSFAYSGFFIVDFNYNISLWSGAQRFGFLIASFLLCLELTSIESLAGNRKYFVIPFIVVLCLYIVFSFVTFDMDIISWGSNRRSTFSTLSLVGIFVSLFMTCTTLHFNR